LRNGPRGHVPQLSHLKRRRRAGKKPEGVNNCIRRRGTSLTSWKRKLMCGCGPTVLRRPAAQVAYFSQRGEGGEGRTTTNLNERGSSAAERSSGTKKKEKRGTGTKKGQRSSMFRVSSLPRLPRERKRKWERWRSDDGDLGDSKTESARDRRTSRKKSSEKRSDYPGHGSSHTPSCTSWKPGSFYLFNRKKGKVSEPPELYSVHRMKKRVRSKKRRA